jgi:hypothetical protein
VSAHWQIQHRLLQDKLDAIETRPTPKQLTQLTKATRTLLTVHPVNRNGYCHICIGSRWWRFPRTICTIYAAFTHPRPTDQHNPQDDTLSPPPDQSHKAHTHPAQPTTPQAPTNCQIEQTTAHKLAIPSPRECECLSLIHANCFLVFSPVGEGGSAEDCRKIDRYGESLLVQTVTHRPTRPCPPERDPSRQVGVGRGLGSAGLACSRSGLSGIAGEGCVGCVSGSRRI